MSLPGEIPLCTQLAQDYAELFAHAENAHQAAVGVVLRVETALIESSASNKGVSVVIAGLLTKALKTFRAIQLVCEAGLGQDASVLLRQLFETTLAVGFILKTDSVNRATMLVVHERQRHLVMLRELRRLSGTEGIATDEDVKAAEHVLQVTADHLGADLVDSVRRHWSGNSVEWAAGELGLSSFYGTLYRITSSIAHGSDVMTHFSLDISSGTPTLKLIPTDDHIVPVLISAGTLLRMLTDWTNKSLRCDESDAVEQIASAVLAMETFENVRAGHAS